MKIKFSRHARRRMKLYDIDEQDVVESVMNNLNRVGTAAGKKEIVDEKYKQKYLYPLKTVFVVESELVTIVTTYPMKGKRDK